MKISIKGLEAFGHHGVMPEEKRLGQTLLLDIDLDLGHDWRPAADDVSATIDYVQVCALAVEIVARTRFDLLESLANAIIKELTGKYQTKSVAVGVWKTDPPMTYTVKKVGVIEERNDDGKSLS